jgi:hypothetical protein
MMDNETRRDVSEGLDALAEVLASQTAAIVRALIEAGAVTADQIEAAMAKHRPLHAAPGGFRAYEKADRQFKSALLDARKGADQS